MRKSIVIAVAVAISTIHYSVMGYFGYDLTPRSEAIIVYSYSLLLALWCLEDAKVRNYHRPYEFGAFIFFLWPFVLPAYLFHTRGWRGVRLFIVFLFLSYLPGICGWLSFYMGPAYGE